MSQVDATALLAECHRAMRASPTCDVPPFARIRLYDALVGDGSFQSRLVEKRWSDGPMGQHQQYHRLAILTTRHVLPAWDSHLECLAPDLQYWPDLPRFPHQIVAAVEAMERGEIEASLLTEPDPYLGDTDPYTALGALPFYVNYNCAEVACAAFATLHVMNGDLPIRSVPQSVDWSAVTDKVLDRHSGNWDVAWHAAEAVSAIDRDPPGAEVRTKIEYDHDKRRKFWEWWLSTVGELMSEK